MDARTEKQSLDALRGYVTGDLSEPVVISAFRNVPLQERTDLVNRHRSELAAMDGGRFLIARSLLLPLAQRDG